MGKKNKISIGLFGAVIVNFVGAVIVGFLASEFEYTWLSNTAANSITVIVFIYAVFGLPITNYFIGSGVSIGEQYKSWLTDIKKYFNG